MVIFGGPQETREEAGPRFTCSIRHGKKGGGGGGEEAYARWLDGKGWREGGGGGVHALGCDKDGRRHNEQGRKLEEDFCLNVKIFFLPPPSCFSLQTDAKADGCELAENGRKKK